MRLQKTLHIPQGIHRSKGKEEYKEFIPAKFYHLFLPSSGSGAQVKLELLVHLTVLLFTLLLLPMLLAVCIWSTEGDI